MTFSDISVYLLFFWSFFPLAKSKKGGYFYAEGQFPSEVHKCAASKHQLWNLQHLMLKLHDFFYHKYT